ncbi:hypothetical protein BKA58DRAFT_349406 [Alternaria rosae]|uniref:uncharacterized protein n=1 Tax=Alternaria rosae TaxID=1187941 RepID=UPI001E8DDC5D|nr:uncharacterized protein BKA58DRAFT_349406 [Alternaria rosae]KAH6881332.1 hypothetical protein BKA58DRAFT_349406 [Alternaria rosae]
MPPKRTGEAVTTPKPAKKVKTGGTPTRTSPRNKTSGSETPPANSTVRKPRKPAHPGSKAVKAPDADADFEWGIMDGDKRETLVVGDVQPSRLTLKFHHRHDNDQKNRSFTYDRRPEADIDWDLKEHVADINKWRNQIFVQSMKFPPKVTHTPWAPFETGYLELFHEKLLEAATGKTDAFVAPHNEIIFKAFNEYFEGRTDIRDKNDKLTPKLKKSKADDVWMPTITDDEIEQYIRGDWKPVVDTATATDDGDGEEEDEDQAEEEDEGDDSDTSTLSTPPDTDEERESLEIFERDRHAIRRLVTLKLPASNAPGSKLTGNKRPTIKPTSDTRGTIKVAPGRKSTKQQSSSQKPMTDPRKGTEAPEPKGKPRWVKPAEQKVMPDPPEVLAAAKDAGWKWSSMPDTDEEAVSLQRASKPADSVDTTWNHQAVKDLDKRIKKSEKYTFGHEFFNNDLKEDPFVKKKNARREFEDWHEGHAREDGAAAVTAMLNTADIPPVGYMGDIHDLVTKKQLPEDELVLAESRAAAIKKKNALIKRKYSPKKGQPVQRDVMDDSESTGDESVDDEDEPSDDGEDA